MLRLGHAATMTELIAANAAAGRYFFSHTTMRFFGCRLSQAVWSGADGWYFVTSERRPPFQDILSGKRRWSVRVMTEAGFVATVGEFGGYRTASAATWAARKAAIASR